MDVPSAAIAYASSTESPDTRLRGRRKDLARIVWVALFALNLIWFGFALAWQVAAIQRPCAAAACLLTPAQAERLRDLGVGLGAVAAYYVGMPSLSVVASLILAVLLFWRRSNDWLVLVVSLFLVYRVESFAYGSYDVNTAGILTLIVPPLDFADVIIFYGVLLIFPDGRFVPRWAWLLLVAWAAGQLAAIAATQTGIAPSSAAGITPIALVTLAYPVLYLSALAVQIYRFRRVSNARQRQQTKWVILGFAVALGANVLYWIVLPLAIPPFLTPTALSTVSLLYPIVAWPIYELATVALPVSFFIAIQRHQLFDVDALIRRTLVYGTLTLILAALYFALVIGAQRFTQAFTGQQVGQQPVVVVLSTLLIAVLFTPLRRRLQVAIDRRFYRAKYDSALTLERFAATLRTETNLPELSEQLMAVVHETMRPALVSLWLREYGNAPMEDHATSSD